jgi:hypothetical protein
MADELATRIINEDRLQSSIANIDVTLPISGDPYRQVQTISSPEPRVFRISEIKDMYSSGTKVCNKDPVPGIGCYSVRFLQLVIGRFCFFWTRDDINGAVEYRVLTLDVLARGKLAYKDEVWQFFLAAFSLERARRAEGHHGQTEEEDESNSWISPHKLILSGTALRRRMVIRGATAQIRLEPDDVPSLSIFLVILARHAALH